MEDREWWIRPYDGREDRAAVLSFQRETYELNFPDFVWSTSFIRDFERILKMAERDPSEGLFVCEDATGRTAGFVWSSVSMRRFEGGQSVCTIKDMYVVPDLRGQGVGMALMQAAEDFARRWKASRMALEVTVANRAAVRLYEKAGFTPTRYQMEKRLD
ncbi:MAG TPA: GNAT family N-acetyltransferase [Armatimonadota bacterium]|nr:GNAT family N-acetyltransferase [Armatimonadota bacterium]